MSDKCPINIKAMLYAKKSTECEYQLLNKVSASTAVRNLEFLVENGVLIMKGERKGAFYELSNGV